MYRVGMFVTGRKCTARATNARVLQVLRTEDTTICRRRPLSKNFTLSPSSNHLKGKQDDLSYKAMQCRSNISGAHLKQTLAKSTRGCSRCFLFFCHWEKFKPHREGCRKKMREKYGLLPNLPRTPPCCNLIAFYPSGFGPFGLLSKLS